MGQRRPVRTSGARTKRFGRDPQSAPPELRPVSYRRRAGGAGRPAFGAYQDALRTADPGCYAGPRDGWGARRQPSSALHTRVRLWLGARRARWRTAIGARAGDPCDGPGGAGRRLRCGGRWWHGFNSGSLSRRRHHRRDQGALHRHWCRERVWHLAELLETNASRRISGYGRGADRPPLRVDGPAADHGSQYGGRRGPAAPAAAAAHFRGPRGSFPAQRYCRYSTAVLPMPWF